MSINISGFYESPLEFPKVLMEVREDELEAYHLSSSDMLIEIGTVLSIGDWIPLAQQKIESIRTIGGLQEFLLYLIQLRHNNTPMIELSLWLKDMCILILEKLTILMRDMGTMEEFYAMEGLTSSIRTHYLERYFVCLNGKKITLPEDDLDQARIYILRATRHELYYHIESATPCPVHCQSLVLTNTLTCKQ